eukprot:Gb_29444 [translate_table: standard]
MTDCITVQQFVPEDSIALTYSKNVIITNAEYACHRHLSSLLCQSTFSASISVTNKDAVFNKVFAVEYTTEFSGMNSQIMDSDISSKFINTTMPHLVSINSAPTTRVPSALDLLAATYNDASNSDEVIDAIENGDWHPMYGHSGKVNRKGIKEVSLQSLDHSPRRKVTCQTSAFEFTTDIHQRLHVSGIDSSASESPNQQEKPIVMRETPGSDGLPRNRCDHRMIQLADNVVQMSESSKACRYKYLFTKESKENNVGIFISMPMPTMDNTSVKTAYCKAQTSNGASSIIQGSGAAYVFQESIPSTATWGCKTASLWKPNRGFMRPRVLSGACF